MDIEVRWREGSQGILSYGKLSFTCALGKTGITDKKREGDHATPIGRFPLRWLFFRADKVPELTSALPQQPISELDGWCDEPEHDRYNQYVRQPFEPSHEKMWREDNLYDLVVVLGHNDAPATPGLGSCIFLHVAKPDYAPTEGCVALNKNDLLELLSTIKAETHIHILPPEDVEMAL